MSNIKQYLKAVDEMVNTVKPNTMDDLISTVAKVEGGKTYGHHYYIVHFNGVQQGIRVAVIGKSKEHLLPAPDKVYAVHNGLEKYYENNWPVVHVDATGKEIKYNGYHWSKYSKHDL